jgi:uncharacterized protein DUF2017
VAWGRGVQPLRGGGHRVRIGDDERRLLGSLALELREAIEAEDQAVARLYPPAYRDDERANDEYGRLTRGELTAGRVAALRRVEATCRDSELSEADANAWCGALNDLRLVLGERLGVTEELYEVGIDPGDPRAPELALYGWLTWLQGELVESLASRLSG